VRVCVYEKKYTFNVSATFLTFKKQIFLPCDAILARYMPVVVCLSRTPMVTYDLLSVFYVIRYNTQVHKIH